MPDLQTELSKVLNTWNTPEEKQVESHTTQTVHIGKRVFDLREDYNIYTNYRKVNGKRTAFYRLAD